MGVEATDSLWVYACGLYRRDGIKRQCLDLQNEHGGNVNVVLWLCWLDANQVQVDVEALDQALTIVGGVNHELLLALRDVRSQLVASSSFTRVQEQLIRKHILSAELAIEKVILHRLQDLTARLVRGAQSQDCLTLFDYLDLLGLGEPGATAVQLLEQSRAYATEQQYEESTTGGA